MRRIQSLVALSLAVLSAVRVAGPQESPAAEPTTSVVGVRRYLVRVLATFSGASPLAVSRAQVPRTYTAQPVYANICCV